MPIASTELIFVDDGSTDGSGEWLDGLATRHSHVRVIHQPNSGWAGRPRNVGLESATGQFVHFVDQDDALGPEALERLVGYASKHSADIVLGKVTSDFRRVPRELYRVNVPRCSIQDVPLIRTLTPHKLFRRSFLVENKLRFPEGRRRLEDQLFVVQAFFATDAVAILADYPCYFFLRRDDDEHSAKLDYDPADYYDNLREVLDVVAANTDPGEFRDGLHEKFLNTMLRKVSGAAKPGSDDRLAAFVAAIRSVIGDYFSPRVIQRPPILRRQLTAAMLSDKPKMIRWLNRRYARFSVQVRSLAARPVDGGRWQVSASASLVFRDGTPVRFRPEGDAWRIDKRLRVANLDVRPDSTEELLTSATGDVVLRSAATGVEWLGPTVLTANLEPTGKNDRRHLVVSGVVELDPQTFAAGGPVPQGTWHVHLRVTALGTSRRVPVRKQRGIEVSRPLLRSRSAPKLRFRSDGRLVLVVPPG